MSKTSVSDLVLYILGATPITITFIFLYALERFKDLYESKMKLIKNILHEEFEVYRDVSQPSSYVDDLFFMNLCRYSGLDCYYVKDHFRSFHLLAMRHNDRFIGQLISHEYLDILENNFTIYTKEQHEKMGKMYTFNETLNILKQMLT